MTHTQRGTDDLTYSSHIITVTGQSSYIDGFTISDGDATGGNDGTHQCTDCFGAGVYFRNPMSPNLDRITTYISSDSDNNDTKHDKNGTHWNKEQKQKQKQEQRSYYNWIEKIEEINNPKYYLTISNCIFRDNKAITGAGLFVFANVEVTISNCQFSDNSAIPATYHVSGGGAIYASVRTDLTITDSSFT